MMERAELMTAGHDGRGRERAAAAASIGRKRGLWGTEFTVEAVQPVQNVVKYNVRLKCPPIDQPGCHPRVGEPACLTLRFCST